MTQKPIDIELKQTVEIEGGEVHLEINVITAKKRLDEIFQQLVFSRRLDEKGKAEHRAKLVRLQDEWYGTHLDEYEQIADNHIQEWIDGARSEAAILMVVEKNVVIKRDDMGNTTVTFAPHVGDETVFNTDMIDSEVAILDAIDNQTLPPPRRNAAVMAEKKIALLDILAKKHPRFVAQVLVFLAQTGKEAQALETDQDGFQRGRLDANSSAKLKPAGGRRASRNRSAQ